MRAKEKSLSTIKVGKNAMLCTKQHIFLLFMSVSMSGKDEIHYCSQSEDDICTLLRNVIYKNVKPNNIVTAKVDVSNNNPCVRHEDATLPTLSPPDLTASCC